MNPAIGSGSKGPLIQTLKPGTASSMQKWAEEHIDKETISGEVVSMQELQNRRRDNRPYYMSSQFEEDVFIIQYKGYTWKILAPLATQTSNKMKREIQKHRANNTHREPMQVNVSDLCPDLNIPPYVFDEVVTFWYELRVSMAYEKRMIIKKVISSPEDAPPNRDYTDTMSGLMSLVHLHDASYALDDDLLKRLTTEALRERLISMKYDLIEWIEAMDNAYLRKPNCEKNRLLRKIFLSSAIAIHDRIVPDEIEGPSFLHQQYWHQDFCLDYSRAIIWYYQHYQPSMRMKFGVGMSSEALRSLKEM